MITLWREIVPLAQGKVLADSLMGAGREFATRDEQAGTH
jgi:hypothetical protein